MMVIGTVIISQSGSDMPLASSVTYMTSNHLQDIIICHIICIGISYAILSVSDHVLY